MSILKSFAQNRFDPICNEFEQSSSKRMSAIDTDEPASGERRKPFSHFIHIYIFHSVYKYFIQFSVDVK